MPVRIYEIAKKLNLESRFVLVRAKELGISAAKVPSSSLDKITAEYLEQQLLPHAQATPPAPAQDFTPVTIIRVPAPVIEEPRGDAESDSRYHDEPASADSGTAETHAEPSFSRAPHFGQNDEPAHFRASEPDSGPALSMGSPSAPPPVQNVPEHVAAAPTLTHPPAHPPASSDAPPAGPARPRPPDLLLRRFPRLPLSLRRDLPLPPPLPVRPRPPQVPPHPRGWVKRLVQSTFPSWVTDGPARIPAVAMAALVLPLLQARPVPLRRRETLRIRVANSPPPRIGRPHRIPPFDPVARSRLAVLVDPGKAALVLPAPALDRIGRVETIRDVPINALVIALAEPGTVDKVGVRVSRPVPPDRPNPNCTPTRRSSSFARPSWSASWPKSWVASRSRSLPT